MRIYAIRSALMSELEDLDDNRTLDEIAEPAFDGLYTEDAIALAVERAKEDLEGGFRDEFDAPFDSTVVLAWETEPAIPNATSKSELVQHNLYDNGDLVGRVCVLATDIGGLSD